MYRKKRFQRRKRFNRKRRSMGLVKRQIGSSRVPPKHYHIVHDIIESNQRQVASGISYAINPTTAPQWPQLRALYDRYKVIGVTFDFIPKTNVNMATYETVQNTIVQWLDCPLYLKFDKDDAVAPATEFQALQENYTVRQSTKRFRFRVTAPKFAEATNEGGALAVRFGIHSCQDNPGIIDGWLKVFRDITAEGANTGGYQIVVKYLIQFIDYNGVGQQPGGQ